MRVLRTGQAPPREVRECIITKEFAQAETTLDSTLRPVDLRNGSSSGALEAASEALGPDESATSRILHESPSFQAHAFARGYETGYCASESGTGADNPIDPISLNPESRRRALLLRYEHTDHFDMLFAIVRTPGAPCCSTSNGRIFLFGGWSEVGRGGGGAVLCAASSALQSLLLRCCPEPPWIARCEVPSLCL